VRAHVVPEAMTELVIAPGRQEEKYWRGPWYYRELLWVLAWRAVSARCKETAVGVAWALLQRARDADQSHSGIRSSWLGATPSCDPGSSGAPAVGERRSAYWPEGIACRASSTE
jgi:hypothetical protein